MHYNNRIFTTEPCFLGDKQGLYSIFYFPWGKMLNMKIFYFPIWKLQYISPIVLYMTCHAPVMYRKTYRLYGIQW